jgi:hypothetical protein
MHVLAAVAALLLVGLAFTGCGPGADIECVGTCDVCLISNECCGDAVCTALTSDGRARCSPVDFFCKLAP